MSRVLRPGRGLALAALVAVAACSSEKIADNTTDAVVFTGKTIVRGAVGAGKLVYKGAAAGVRALQEPTDEYPAGTIVCLAEDGRVYAAVEEVDGKSVCPPPPDTET